MLNLAALTPDVANGCRVFVHYNGPTDQLSGMCTGMAVLDPGATPHPPHQHPEEEFMIVADGTARPLHTQAAATPDAIWLSRPRLNGHAAGVGWGEGRACVIQCECELSRVAPGDILVTRVAGPALSHILTRVAGVVAERGGSTSHMASLARERGIPMVLGVLDATSRIPDGSTVAVDGVAGVVRWMASV